MEECGMDSHWHALWARWGGSGARVRAHLLRRSASRFAPRAQKRAAKHAQSFSSAPPTPRRSAMTWISPGAASASPRMARWRVMQGSSLPCFGSECEDSLGWNICRILSSFGRGRRLPMNLTSLGSSCLAFISAARLDMLGELMIRTYAARTVTHRLRATLKAL